MLRLSSLISLLKKFLDRLRAIYTTLSPERVIVFWISITFSLLFFFFAITTYIDKFLVTVPNYGGTLREGIVGTPRFINPVLAVTEQDKDLTALIFAGLTKKDSDGHIVLNMAESVVPSEDGLTYTVKLKDNAYFHDGKKVVADDILYTISLIKNPVIKHNFHHNKICT
jgi:peptide/nickel transport system substrate-binding protein